MNRYKLNVGLCFNKYIMSGKSKPSNGIAQGQWVVVWREMLTCTKLLRGKC